MFFYTNVSRLGNAILFRGIKDGERVERRVKFRPRHFVEDQKNPTKYRSLYGDPVSPIEFDSMKEATEFRSKYKDVPNFHVYGMENYVYQFIAEAFPHDIKFDANQIRIGSIDIETYSGDGFPEPDVAEQEVISISYKDYQHNTFYVWGLNDYDPSKNDRNIEYFKCSSETDMLVAFTNWWCSADNWPDVITGWNSKMFDMPYLINRIIRTIGEETAKKFSPWGKLNPRTKINNLGQEENFYEIVGVSQLDYYDLFLKFGVLTYGRQERYTLDHIAYQVLGEKKVDYSEYGSLQNLYEQNHQLFIDYNIIDVDLVDKLEQTMNLIGLVFTMAYKAKTNYNDAFGTTGIWDAVVYNELKKRDIIIPAKNSNIKTDIVGGYVKPPLVIGQVDWVTSFDFESLYPNIMVQYNISPEMLVDPSYEGEMTLPANNARFRRDVEGIFPQVIKKFYGDRRAAKKKMIEAKQELVMIEEEMKKRGNEELVELRDNAKNMISKFNNEQMAIKILSNSLYGATSNIHFRYYDALIAESVTTTGQRSIKLAEKAMNDEMNRLLETDDDYVVAIDTDSIYVNMKPMIDKFQPADPVEFLSKISEEYFKGYFQKVFDQYAEETNAYTNRMVLEREVIADRGIWTAKKRYILRVHDVEGVRYSEPEMKVMGIEAVKSSTPQICRDKFQEIFKVILDGGEKKTQEFVEEFYEQFCKLDPSEIAFPRGVSDVKKYQDRHTIYKKGTPIHSRGSLLHNHHLREKGLLKKYEEIRDGDKIKYTYLKKHNPIRENVIAFKNNHFPKELNLERYIDYDLMFEKAFIVPLNMILEPLGWNPRDEATLEDFFG